MIAIIDYDAGNLKSVEKALNKIGETAVITRNREEILNADHVILPGVGSFADAMNNLKKYQLDTVIHEVAQNQTPFLGICLGLQLLFDSSEESPGVEGLKIPHIGWNSLEFLHAGRLFEGIKEQAYVYFVHSYYLKADDPQIVTASTFYGTKIHASVEKKNIFACQFHPEKSSDVGLRILKNFVSLKKEEL